MKLVIAIVAVLLLAGAIAIVAARRRPSLAAAAPASPELLDSLRRDVAALCAIGERSTVLPQNLNAAASYIERELTAAGYRVERQTYRVERDGVDAVNLIVEIRGSGTPASRRLSRRRPRRRLPPAGETPAPSAGEDAGVPLDDIVVIGAHYDSVSGAVGADDNASGVAALLALARRSAHAKPARTLRFVAFTNEEPPHFQSQDMGSWQYAKRCHDRGERIAAMLSLESLGYYDTRPGSQHYPAPLSTFYPDVANFIAFASNVGSRALTSRCVRAFRARTPFPFERASVPEAVTGIGWSDQWSFWQFGWPAVMVTDTAPFRNPHYHEPSDLPATLDYARFAQVVEGLSAVVEEIVR